MRKISSILFSTLLLLLSTGEHSAADDALRNANSDSPWSFRLAPYAWATALKGTAGVNGVDSDVDVSIKDVLEDVEGGVMTTFEIKYDRWSLTNDIIYANLSDSAPTPHGLVFSDAGYDIKQYMWTQVLGYTVVKEERYTLDVLVGFRLVSLDQTLTLDGATRPNGTEVADREPSRTDTWIDPVIGLRGSVALGSGFFFGGMGDIGGFQANSALTWQAAGILGYRVCNSASIGFGYRGIGYDHNRDGLKFNMDMHGPVIGVETYF